MTPTLIRNADWVIAWDEIAGHHVYRRNLDIAFAAIIPGWRTGSSTAVIVWYYLD